MSELMNTRESRTTFRWQLLTTVSALALLGSVYAAGEAKLRTMTPIVRPSGSNWGAQLSRLDDGQEAFAPPVTAARPSIFSPSQKFEKLPSDSVDETGKISFEPDGSDWVFSASIRYGRSISKRRRSPADRSEQNLFPLQYPLRSPPHSDFRNPRSRCGALCRHQRAERRKPFHSGFSGGQGCRSRHVRRQGRIVRSGPRRSLRAIQQHFQHRPEIGSRLAPLIPNCKLSARSA